MQLNIHKFLTVCTHLVKESSNIIKNIHEQSDLNTLLKGVNDPVTNADFKVQSLIMRGLKMYWPNLKIVGEEDKQYEEEIEYNFKNLEQPLFSQEIFAYGKNNQKLEKSLDISKLTVWVDPVDGTLSYTQGLLNEVTTMIGVSYEGKARLGVIGSHYTKTSSGNKVFLGDSLNKNAYEVDKSNKIQKINPRMHLQEDCRLCISKSHMSSKSLKRMQEISENITRLGGFGKKTLQVIQNKSDTFIYLGEGIGTWDVCAPDALIRSIGGRLTDSKGEMISYSKGDKKLIRQGAILSINQKLHHQVIDKIK